MPKELIHGGYRRSRVSALVTIYDKVLDNGHLACLLLQLDGIPGHKAAGRRAAIRRVFARRGMWPEMGPTQCRVEWYAVIQAG